MNRIEEPYYRNPGLELGLKSSSPSTSSESETESSPSSLNINMDSKTVIIILLIFFIVLTFLGLNIISSLGNFMESIYNVIMPIVNQFLIALGYSAGTALDKVSDVSADVAKGGIDLADGALNNIGGLLKGSVSVSGNNIPSSPPQMPIEPPPEMPIEPPPEMPIEPSPDSSENVIQKPISSDKWNWCLVGEYQNKRGCIEITDSDKCFSGQIFPSQKMCLNPTWTP
jgi:hypothetical protein